jgi:hypothetical protein
MDTRDHISNLRTPCYCRTMALAALAALASLVLLVLCLGHVAVAQAPGARTFDETLQFSEDAWVFGDYDLVVETLQPLLFPTPPPVAEEVLVRAYTRLGSAAYYEGDRVLAQECFLALLLLEPSHELDRLLFPAQVIQVFDEVRREHAAELGVEDENTTPGDGRTVYLLRSSSTQSRLVSALPLGYGFFVRGQDLEGSLYLVSESALAVTSGWLFALNEVERGSDGLFDDASLARRRQRAQVGTGIGFLVLVAANAIHGLLTHEDETNVRFQSLDEPPDELDEPRGRRLQLSPAGVLRW